MSEARPRAAGGWWLPVLVLGALLAGRAPQLIAAGWLGVEEGFGTGLRAGLMAASGMMWAVVAAWVVAALVLRDWDRGWPVVVAVALVVMVGGDGWVARGVAVAVGVAMLVGLLLKKVPEEGRWVKRGGWGAAALVAAAGVWNGVWVAQNWNVVEPVGRGDVAPGFALQELSRDGTPTGATVQLESLRGQVVLLDFWASWCDPCVRGIPFLGELQRRYRKDGFAVVSIKLDGRRLGRARRALEQTDFLLALATEEVANRYQVTSLPHLVLIDRTGVVRHLWRGAGEKLASQIEELLAR